MSSIPLSKGPPPAHQEVTSLAVSISHPPIAFPKRCGPEDCLGTVVRVWYIFHHPQQTFVSTTEELQEKPAASLPCLLMFGKHRHPGRWALVRDGRTERPEFPAGVMPPGAGGGGQRPLKGLTDGVNLELT